ncbi:hypothetical protein, partial [Mycobacterium intracellulare]|uniref:hypothetical protein n=1 Tax=Mycobacterium intracellulare TaxID=1767 RepID=UPI0013DFD867
MNGPDLAALMGAAAAVPRLPDAACRGRTEMADVDIKTDRATTDALLEICLGCSEMQRCSGWLDSLSANQRPRGVCGGRLWDPDAPKTAREMMAAERKAVAPPTMPRPHSP